MDDDRQRLYQDLREWVELDLCAGVLFADFTSDPYRLPLVVDGPVDIPATSSPHKTAPTVTLGHTEDDDDDDHFASIHAQIALPYTMIPGFGSAEAGIVFIGDYPSESDVKNGQPFHASCGEGALLNRMIAAMGFSRDEVYTTNIIRHHPVKDSTQLFALGKSYLPYLEQELAIIQPQVICLLGDTALKVMSGDSNIGLTGARNQDFDWNGIPMIATHHPRYLRRQEGSDAERIVKTQAWQDLKRALDILGLTPPASKK